MDEGYKVMAPRHKIDFKKNIIKIQIPKLSTIDFSKVKMNNLSESIEYGYKLSKNIDVARRGENIILISEDISRCSVKYSDKSFKELCDLKDKGTLSSSLLETQSLTSNKSALGNSPLLISLLKLGLLSLSIYVNSKIIASFDHTRPLTYSISRLSDNASFSLSSFCWIKLIDGKFVLQNQSQSSQLIVYDFEFMRIISEISKDTTIEHLINAFGEINSSIISSIIKLMLSNNLLHLNRQISSQTSSDNDINFWGFEDLLFHERSRWGPHNQFIGANFPFAETMPAPSITPTIHSIKEISLLEPHEGELIDQSFFEIILKRKSYHEFGNKPVSLKNLGLLLWFVLHIKRRHKIQAISERKTYYEITKRPVPGGGGMHEIEIFLAINRSEEIDSGMYHYNAEKHCLEMVRVKDKYCNQLLKDAALAGNLSKPPDILIVLGYRPRRLSWKYQGIVYSLVLEHVGIIFQQLYLVSTALGLAPCALGVGNSRTFQYAVMDDSSQESIHSVGEFIIGSKPNPEDLD